VILPRQGADGIVVDASAGDLGTTELRLGLEAGDEREPREVLRLEDHVVVPETDAVAGFGETAYLGARAILILPRVLLGLWVVELLVPGGPYVLLGARTGVDDLELAAYVWLLDGERRAVVLGDNVASARYSAALTLTVASRMSSTGALDSFFLPFFVTSTPI
jgi:hypothetical protein